MKKKIILLVCIGIIFLGGIILLLGKDNKKVAKSDLENKNTVSQLQDNEINSDVIEVTEDKEIKENVVVTEEPKETNEKLTDESNLTVIKKEENTSKQETTKKKEDVKEPVSKTEVKQETKPEIKEEPKEEIVEQPKQEPIQKEPEKPVTNTEEYRYNSEMTQKIISIINNNPSDYMKQYGFNVVEDKSITKFTNQFTFSENRVKTKIQNKFGTIKVYAQDYYLNNTYISTECFIY